MRRAQLLLAQWADGFLCGLDLFPLLQQCSCLRLKGAVRGPKVDSFLLQFGDLFIPRVALSLPRLKLGKLLARLSQRLLQLLDCVHQAGMLRVLLAQAVKLGLQAAALAGNHLLQFAKPLLQPALRHEPLAHILVGAAGSLKLCDTRLDLVALGEDGGMVG